MNRRQIIDELLELVDNDPLNEVDIKPLLVRYTEGKDISEEWEIRQSFTTEMTRLRKAEEIDFNENQMRLLIGKNEHGFFSHSCMISSTMKRDKENKEKLNKPPTYIQQIGSNSGIITQDSKNSFRDFQPIQNPPIIPTIPAAKDGIITSIGKFIMKHIWPIIVTIIATVVAAYIVYKLRWV